MTIKPISIFVILAASKLIAEYAAECSIPTIGPTNPQHELYGKLEKSGALKCFGAFEGDELVGFGNVLVYVLPHYGKTIATVESLFVAESHRHLSTGKSLMISIESYAHGTGCAGILYSAPAGGKLEQLLDTKPEYQRTNAVFFRGLL
jgi:GNAT superfamily N-acetyltransferase